MSLYGYRRKGRPNIAMAAFPGQFRRFLSEYRRAPIRRVSKRQAQRLILYRALRDAWLAIHPTCEVCGEIIPDRRNRTLHHQRGRAGKLLTEMKFWSCVHRHCHDWIGNNPAQARVLGVLCEAGDWGRQPEE